MRKPGRKLSAFQEYSALVERGEVVRYTPKETQSINHASLAVRGLSDEADERFFLREELTKILSEDEAAALDTILEKHGLRNLLSALVQLLESRVEESSLVNGRLLHHLAREDDYSYAAERVLGLIYDERVSKL